MSCCLVLMQNNNIYIGADTAMSIVVNDQKYRIDNNMKKLFSIENYVIFCSGLKYNVDDFIFFLRSDGINIKNIQKYLKDKYECTKKDIFDIEVFIVDYNYLKCYQISQYNNFEVNEYKSTNNIQIISCGYRTNDVFECAKQNLINGKSVYDIYKNSFEYVNNEAIGGHIELYSSPFSLIKIDIDDRYNIINTHLLTSDFVVSGFIEGSQLISGDIYSKLTDDKGYPLTHINLNDGSFSFGGDKFVGYKNEDDYIIKVSGEVNAQSGKIGRMTVDDNGLIIDTSIHRENSEDGNGNSDSEDLEADADVIQLAGDATRFYINSKQYGHTDIEYDRNPSDILPLYLEVNDAYWQYTPKVPFYLDVDGELYTSKIKATGGKIGNLEIKNDGLLLDNRKTNGKQMFISNDGCIRFLSNLAEEEEDDNWEGHINYIELDSNGLLFHKPDANNCIRNDYNNSGFTIYSRYEEADISSVITVNPIKLKLENYLEPGNYENKSFVELQGGKILIKSIGLDSDSEIKLEADSINLNGIKSCYSEGDTISGSIFVAGYMTGSSKGLRFTIPLSKPIKSGSSLNINSIKVTIRQGGKYCCGSSSTSDVTPSSTTLTIFDDSIRVAATMDNTENVVNNDVCGISCTYNFSVE